MNNIENSIINAPDKPEIAIYNKIIKELNIIDKIFNAQLFKNDEIGFIPYLLDSKGISCIQGRYFNTIDIFSNVELFKLQDYISEFTQRYENTNNNSILKNDLAKIREKANEILDSYKNNLTKESIIVNEYKGTILKLLASKKVNKKIEFWRRHSAVITISNYNMNIYSGCDKSNEKIKNNTNHNFWYCTHNNTLAFFCKELIKFIDIINSSHESPQTVIPKKDKGQPPKPLSKKLTIKDIVYPENWDQFEKYLNTKENIDKYQYKNLFVEMKLKKYTLPEYYNISLEQMKAIIFNYFGEKVSIGSIKGKKTNNIFNGMPKAEDKLVIE